MQSRNITFNYIFFCSARRGHRASSRRKASIPKSTRGQTWSQTMRNLVRTGFTKAATLSKRTGRTAQQTLDDITGGGKQQKATKTSSATQTAAVPTGPSASSVPAAYEPIYQLRKVPARRHPSAETEASGTGSSQTWEDCGKPLTFHLFIAIAVRFFCCCCRSNDRWSEHTPTIFLSLS